MMQLPLFSIFFLTIPSKAFIGQRLAGPCERRAADDAGGQLPPDSRAVVTAAGGSVMHPGECVELRWRFD